MLKDNWIDKVDNVDYVYAGDINSIAHAVIEAEEEIEGLNEDGAVQTRNIADGAVTTQKIADGSITDSKAGSDVQFIKRVDGESVFSFAEDGIYYCESCSGLPSEIEGRDVFVIRAGGQLSVLYSESSGRTRIWSHSEELGVWVEGVNIPASSITEAMLANGINISKFVNDVGYGAGGAIEDGSITTGKLADGAVTPEKTTFFEQRPTKNMFDINAVVIGHLNGDGSIAEDPRKATSDYMAVGGAEKYCIEVHNRNRATDGIVFAFFNAQKVALSWQRKATEAIATVDGAPVPYLVVESPEDAAYMRVSYTRTLINTTENTMMQIEAGETPTSYVPYDTIAQISRDFGLLEQGDIEDSLESQSSTRVLSANQGRVLNEKIVEQESALSDIIANLGQNGELSVVIGENTLSVTGKIGKTQTVTIGGTFASANGNFNLNSSVLYKNGVSQKGGLTGTDEFAPLRTNHGTIGGNHRHTFVGVSDSTETLAGYVGQTCTANGNTFLLVEYDEATMIGAFLKPYTINADGLCVISSATIAEGDTLEFDGGTTVTAGAISSVLRSSINKHSHSYLVDGAKKTAQGTYHCNTFALKEAYDLVSYSGIWDYYSENDGTPYLDAKENIAGCMRIEHIYTFGENCGLLINTTYRAIDKVLLSDCGVIQNAMINKVNSTDSIYLYINKAGEVNGYDFSSGVDMTGFALSSDIVLTPDNSQGTPNRNVIRDVDANGNLVYGFSAGYIPDMSMASDSAREGLARVWRVSRGSKTYPVAIFNKTMLAGESLTFLAYRTYLPEETPVTNFNIVDVGNTAYLFIDAHEAGYYSVEIDPKYCGRAIEVLERSNINIPNDVVGYTVSFTVTDTKGYATLKLR